VQQLEASPGAAFLRGLLLEDAVGERDGPALEPVVGQLGQLLVRRKLCFSILLSCQRSADRDPTFYSLR
jgi:hypothetical protein